MENSHVREFPGWGWGGTNSLDFPVQVTCAHEGRRVPQPCRGAGGSSSPPRCPNSVSTVLARPKSDSEGFATSLPSRAATRDGRGAGAVHTCSSVKPNQTNTRLPEAERAERRKNLYLTLYETWSKNAWTELEKPGQRKAEAEPNTDHTRGKAAKERDVAWGRHLMPVQCLLTRAAQAPGSEGGQSPVVPCPPNPSLRGGTRPNLPAGRWLLKSLRRKSCAGGALTSCARVSWDVWGGGGKSRRS